MTITYTNDADIRAALHRQHLRRVKQQQNTLVVDELGLAHAKSRIDVAVINGVLHGYEIKSAKDDLSRLSRQMQVYEQTLQRLTFVVAPKHLEGVCRLAPEWCGLLLAEPDHRSRMKLTSVRPTRLNPDIDPVMFSHLLWKSEVVQLLCEHGYEQKALRGSRLQLYEMLVEIMDLPRIVAAVRNFMIQRTAWRDHQVHARCGD